MATTRNIKIQRTITWEENSSATSISFKEYIQKMKQFGEEKAKTTRTSRRYLRSLGLELDRNGFVINK